MIRIALTGSLIIALATGLAITGADASYAETSTPLPTPMPTFNGGPAPMPVPTFTGGPAPMPVPTFHGGPAPMPAPKTTTSATTPPPQSPAPAPEQPSTTPPPAPAQSIPSWSWLRVERNLF